MVDCNIIGVASGAFSAVVVFGFLIRDRSYSLMRKQAYEMHQQLTTITADLREAREHLNRQDATTITTASELKAANGTLIHSVTADNNSTRMLVIELRDRVQHIANERDRLLDKVLSYDCRAECQLAARTGDSAIDTGQNS